VQTLTPAGELLRAEAEALLAAADAIPEKLAQLRED
jgi:DNA-binding transcriptional LysR family regulator